VIIESRETVRIHPRTYLDGRLKFLRKEPSAVSPSNWCLPKGSDRRVCSSGDRSWLGFTARGRGE
jgi:hypothetical protein